jgi:outer membrane receptor for ferric coprogen and ferric-rhodotorulic acid
VKGELFDGRLNASAAVFRTDQQNFAVPDGGLFVPGTNEPAMRAVQGAKVKGYEFDLTGQLSPGWEVGLGWTHFSAKDPDGNDLAVDHSRKLLKLFTKLTLPGAWQGVSIGGGVNWESDRPAAAVNPANGEFEKVGQPAYALVDLMARYEFDRHWAAQVNISNVLDKTYRSASHWWGAPYTYGEPRKVLVTLDYRF